MALQVWLPLNGNTDNLGLFGNLTFTQTSTVVDSVSGKIGSCKEFIGGYLNAPFDFTLGNAASYSAWVYYTSRPSSSSNDWVFQAGTSSGTSNTVLGIITYTSSITICIGGVYASYSYTLATDTWYHLAVTWNGSIARLYINGSEVASYTTLNSGTKKTATKLSLAGNVAGSTTRMQGRLNDLRIYDDCLSPQEVKEISQGLVLHYKLDSISNTISDCSGYKYDASMLMGSLDTNNDSPRYNYSLVFDGSSITTSNSPTTEVKTVSFWFKCPNSIQTKFVGFVDYKSGLGFGFGTTYVICSTNVTASAFAKNLFSAGTWQHVVIVNPGSSPSDTTRKLYVNGVEKTSASTNSWTVTPNTLEIGGRSTNLTGYPPFIGLMSDFRMYATALSDADIADLYHTSAIVDNLGNLHTFEAKEDDSTPEIMKTGNAVANNFLELGNRIKTLSDGSVWLHVLHHENPASNLFTADNCWNYNNGSTLYSALWLLKNEEWKYNGKYELLVCEKLTSSSEEAQYRWTQTSNPSTSSSITGFTVISGSGTYFNKGLLNKGTYGAMHNGNTWWCCCGSYTAYQGGIPGMNGIVTTGSLDLYIRITQDIFKSPESDLFFIYENGYVQNELIEI